VREHKQFTKDVETVLKHQSSTVCLEIKNKLCLNQFLATINRTPIQDDANNGDDDDDEEEEEEEEERPHKHKRA
jgi:hypothetical protein